MKGTVDPAALVSQQHRGRRVNRSSYAPRKLRTGKKICSIKTPSRKKIKKRRTTVLLKYIVVRDL